MEKLIICQVMKQNGCIFDDDSGIVYIYFMPFGDIDKTMTRMAVYDIEGHSFDYSAKS